MLLKLIQTFIPEPLVGMHPSCYLSKRFRSKRDKHLAPVLLTLNESRSFQHLQMLRYRVERSVERLGNIQKSGRSAREPAKNRAPRGVRDGRQYIRQLIHGHITP